MTASAGDVIPGSDLNVRPERTRYILTYFLSHKVMTCRKHHWTTGYVREVKRDVSNVTLLIEITLPEKMEWSHQQIISRLAFKKVL